MAYLCYRCYMERFNNDKWDTFQCNTEVRENCEVCRLHGIYVREIKEEK
jgi:hypothetical protein